MKARWFAAKARASLILYGCFVIAVSAQSWLETSAPLSYWSGAASSANGSNLFAVAYADGYGHFGGLFVSTNSGVTWTDRSPAANQWMSVACSALGDKVVAVEGYYGGGFIYVSTNSGFSWAKTSAPSNAWFAVTSSTDGQKLAAASFSPYGDGLIYSSTNGGDSWVPTSAPRLPCYALASSADGIKIIAVASLTVCAGLGCVTSSSIYTSSDSGVSWLGINTSPMALNAAACSADGMKLVAVGDATILSTNSGRSWFTNDTIWGSTVSASADGTRLLVASPGVIHMSTNWGTTWNDFSAPTNFFNGASAVSADGTRILLGAHADHLYQLNTGPIPLVGAQLLNDKLVLSWIIPSTKLVLQQSSDMKNWADVGSSAALNLSNLKLEVQISTSSKAGFYRLSGK